MPRYWLLVLLAAAAASGCAGPEASDSTTTAPPSLTDNQKMSGFTRLAQLLGPAIHEAAMRGLTKESPSESATEIFDTFSITTETSGGQIVASGQNSVTWSTAGFSNLVVEDITWNAIAFELADGLLITTLGQGSAEGTLTGDAKAFTGTLAFSGSVELNAAPLVFDVTFTYDAKVLTFEGTIDQLPVSGLHHFVWPTIRPPLAFIHIGSCMPKTIDWVCVDYYSVEFTPADQQAACEAKDQYYGRDFFCPTEEVLGTCTVVTTSFGGTQTAKERIYYDSGFDDQGGQDVCDELGGEWQLE